MNAITVTLLALSLSSLGSTARADGANTYQQVCSACHGQGVAGAPKAGDAKAWKKLIAEGQVPLTADGYMGVRAMPAKGGKAEVWSWRKAANGRYKLRKTEMELE